MALNNTAVLSSATTIYTSTDETCVVSAFFCNYSLSPVTISVYAVPDGGVADDTTIILKDLDINATDTYILNTERMILGDGDRLVATASAAGRVTATVSSTSV